MFGNATAWRRSGRRALLVAVVALATFRAGSSAQITTSDQPAAIVVYPLLRLDTARGVDTLLRLANTTDAPIAVHCFYVNENNHCTNDGSVCETNADCPEGSCLEGAIETDFVVRVTPFQPIAWLLSEGRTQFPLDGISMTGPGGSSNAGSYVPPASEDPFVGWLQCIAVTPEILPAEVNAIEGEAILYEQTPEHVDAAEYGAIGIQAIAGASDGDNSLLVGTEYSGCPNIVTFDHFFDGAIESPSGARAVETTLALVPCSVDFLRQIHPTTNLEYLVFTEFGQRFLIRSSTFSMLASPLSLLDGPMRDGSPFFAGVAGTLTGKTRLRSAQTGMLGIAIEAHSDIADPNRKSRAAFNLHAQGSRATVDTIVLP